MSNSYVNKVIYDGNVLIDLTSDTITAADLAYGKIAHDKSGAEITGTNTKDSNTTDANATAAQILSGKTAYVNKNKITGQMPNRGAVTGTISTLTPYTIQNGYHDGSGTVSIDSIQAGKIIAGNIKSGVTILGITGNYSGEAVAVESNKNVTPTSSQQIVTPTSPNDYLAQVTVAAIPYTETDNAAGGKTVTIATSV